MAAIGKFVALILLIGGLLLWAVSALPSLFAAGADAADATASVGNAIQSGDDGPATLEGTVIYDGSIPPAAYVEYRLAGGEIRTKQLIYRNARGCVPSAADIPCALPNQNGTPDLASGDRIRVTGTILGDQILIDGLERL